MVIFIPFIVLIIALFSTRNKILSFINGVLASSFVYMYTFKISFKKMYFSFLPSLFFDILSPSEYLYPLLLFLLTSCIIDLLKNVLIFNSYTALYQSFFNKENRWFDFSVVCSSILFFLDDYLIMFGMKSFFTPLVKNSRKDRSELIFYTTFLCNSGPLLFFFSTWSAFIIKQIELIKGSLVALSDVSSVDFFITSKKYFFYPICCYISIFLYSVFQKKSIFTIVSPSKKQSIFYIDIFIFVLLPMSIIINFLYKLYYLGFFLGDLDVSFVMLESVSFANIIIILFLIWYKAVSLRYIFASYFQTLQDYLYTVSLLVSGWLFAKVTMLFLQSELSFNIPILSSSFYPLFYFLLTFFMSFILGCEWGTLGIIIPLLVLIKNSSLSIISISFGAIISGVLAGVHTSPISNNNIMISAIFKEDSMIAYLHRVRFLVGLVLTSLLFYTIIGFVL